MRRSTVIFVMIFMCSVLVACGNKQKQGVSNESENSNNVSTKTEAVSARQRKALIAANSYCSYAINKDGKIVSTKYTGMEASAPDVEKLGTVSYIQANGSVLCGMDDNGRMSGDGAHENMGESTLEYYDNARQIMTDGISFVILTDDGKLKATHRYKSGWLDYISLAKDVDYIESSGGIIIACLKNDGTVTIYADEENGARDSKEWKDIVDIACGYNHVIGLKSDGTVVAAGDNTYGQCDVSEWKDIVEVSANYGVTIGLKSDGTVVAVGDNTYGQCNVSGWKDIVAVVCGSMHTLALKADGTLVAVGSNQYGQCDVEGINNLKTPFD